MKYCRNCGTVLEDSDLYCCKCGTKQQESSASTVYGNYYNESHDNQQHLYTPAPDYSKFEVKKPTEHSTIGIVGLVISIVGLHFVSLILCIIALVKDKDKKKGFSIAGLIVSILGLIYSILMIVVMIYLAYNSSIIDSITTETLALITAKVVL